MSPRATIICNANDFETSGEIPADEYEHATIPSVASELDDSLVRKLRKHHFDTGIELGVNSRVYGHRAYKVFFDGQEGVAGDIVIKCGCIIYTPNRRER